MKEFPENFCIITIIITVIAVTSKWNEIEIFRKFSLPWQNCTQHVQRKGKNLQALNILWVTESKIKVEYEIKPVPLAVLSSIKTDFVI